MHFPIAHVSTRLVTVPVDEPGEDTAEGLNAKGQGGDIKQEQVLHISSEHASLDGSSHGHDLIGVHAPGGLLAKQALDYGLHLYQERVSWTSNCSILDRILQGAPFAV